MTDPPTSPASATISRPRRCPARCPRAATRRRSRAFGLYAEQLSGTAFTAPRAENRRSWLYRMRPSAEHPPYRRYEGAPLFARRHALDEPLPPNRLRWDPLPIAGRADRLRSTAW